MVRFLLPLAGCSLSSPPPLDPGPALSDVGLALDELVERFGAGDPLAAEAWTSAHARFEADLEPLLRGRVDPVEVARTEYAFGVVRRAVAEGQDPRAAVDALVDRLEAQLHADGATAKVLQSVAAR